MLDEPTQGLDPLVQQEFHQIVEEVRREGRTVFLSSHVMPEVERLCDRVAIIREGRLVAVEDVGDLRARQVRVLDIHFAQPPTDGLSTTCPGVSEVAINGDTVRVTASRDRSTPIVKAAARHEVVDLKSHEPSLEDIFLTYYGKE